MHQMTAKRPAKLTLALVALLALLLTACSSSGGAAKPAAGSTPAPAAKKFIVATDTSYAPFEFQKDNKYVGFDIDLLAAVAKEAGFEYELRPMDFNGIIPALQSGNLDMALAAMTIRPERAQVVNFSEPYFKAGLVLTVRTDNNSIKGIADLKGKTVAVKVGSASEKKVKEFPDVKVKEFNNTNDVFLEVKNKGADAGIEDSPVVLYFIQQGNPELKLVGDWMTQDNYGIAVTKTNTDLLAKVNQGLQKVRSSGQYDAMYKKWFGTAPPK